MLAGADNQEAAAPQMFWRFGAVDNEGLAAESADEHVAAPAGNDISGVESDPAAADNKPAVEVGVVDAAVAAVHALASSPAQKQIKR
jgi:hypothetical protein